MKNLQALKEVSQNFAENAKSTTYLVNVSKTTNYQTLTSKDQKGLTIYYALLTS